MAYAVLMFIHVGSMFVATALALGPSVLLYLVARTRDLAAIRRVFGIRKVIFQVGGAAYGLGILFGVLTALNGGIELTSTWLLLAYGLIVLLISVNLAFERWTDRVEVAAANGPEALETAFRQSLGRYTLAGMALVTLAIVFVMVVKPGTSL